MKILIDGRMYGLEHAGIGRYVEQLVKNLTILDTKNDYVILLRKRYFDILKFPKNWKKVLANISHYSFLEQIQLPIIIYKERADLVHFPHFNIPILYFGKFVVTIHDLIKHTSKGKETTTRDPWLYWFKYLGYKLVFNQAIKRASKIIVPSEFVKEDLVKTYGLLKDKVVVTYEGVEDKLKETRQNAKILEKYGIKNPFVIYTGSLYPHKNVERLVEAVVHLNNIYHLSISLVVVCARNVFYERFKQKIREMKAENFVNLVGFVPDEDLAVLYNEAEAFVFPTLSEGFGLPGLEAMSSGCPVICSDIPVLREIYNDAAVYFDPLNVKEIAGRIKELMAFGSEEKKKLANKGFKQAKKYSWEKMAKETISVYESLN